MTELYIQKRLAAYIDADDYPFQIVNGFMYSWECDYWVLSASGNTKEFEIKCDYQDFLKDAKKEKHKLFETKGPNYFYYVVPRGMIAPGDIDKRYGLIYIWETGHVEVAKKPKRLNQLKFERFDFLAQKYYYKWKLLWREKYLNNEISTEQYKEEFFIDLKENE